MKLRYMILMAAVVLCNSNGYAQNIKNMQQQNNPLLCNPDSGVCEMPVKHEGDAAVTKAVQKPVKIVYFTDPICSSCWGIEPQLRKLKLAYGDSIEIEYRMGGLLPDWSYNSGGISKPSDVAHHWDEVSQHYDMPIDGDVWLEDPLPSSYPPSIAFKAAQLQDPDKAVLFLREIREMVFLKKKNITKWEHLEQAAINVGLNISRFRSDYEGKAKELFNEDLDLARKSGVRGFPTLFFADRNGLTKTVYGSKPYIDYEAAVHAVYPKVGKKRPYKTDWKSVFAAYSSLTAREFSLLTNTPRNETEQVLNDLAVNGKLEKISTKNGSVWGLKH